MTFPFERDPGSGLLIINTEIDGKYELKMVLDTGATHTTINSNALYLSGTGDIHLSLVSTVPVTGAVIVTTPQNVSLADAIKGIAMFQMDPINVPVLGLVENMAYFTPPELPDNKYYIFGKDGGKELAEALNKPLFWGEKHFLLYFL